VAVGTAFVLGCLLGANVSLGVGASAEARLRRTDDPAQAREIGKELTLAAPLDLSVLDGKAAYEAAYQPRLTLRSDVFGAGSEVMHEGSLRIARVPGDRWSMALRATGGVGKTDLITENRRPDQPAGTTPDTVATRRVISIERVGFDASLGAAPTRRSTFELRAGVAQDGGADRASRVSLPKERSVSAGADYRYALGLRDAVDLNLSGRASRLENSSTSGTATGTSAFAVALAGWRHRLTTSVDVRAAGGAAWLHERLPGLEGTTQTRTQLQPSAQVDLYARSLARSVDGHASARLAAGIDRLTGEVSRELDSSADLTWTVSPRFTASVRGSGVVAWQREGTSRRGEGELRGAWVVSRYVGAELGGYVAWQNGPAAPSFVEYGVSLALTCRAEPLRWHTGD
jgi:hypothetical protein